MNSKKMFLVFIVFLLGCSEEKKGPFEFNPGEQVEGFYTSDVDLFWQALDYMSPEFTKHHFQTLYIENGSEGLKEYSEQLDLTTALENVFKSSDYREYYKSIRTISKNLDIPISRSQEAFERFKSIYPDLIVFDVYFLIGAMTAGGRIGDNGLLIAVEMFSKTTSSPVSGLTPWHKGVIKTKSYLPSVIVHELAHKHQHLIRKYSGYKTLLEQSLLEGMADFISAYILPDEPFMNEHLHAFGDSLEYQIWLDFQKQMNMNYRDTEWLYSGSTTSSGYPADMGYYVGFKILESYSKTFEDQDTAIIAMLNATDYYQLFEQSGYADKPKQNGLHSIGDIP